MNGYEPLKTRLVIIICACIRLYLQYIPSTIGKFYLWNKIIQPYIAWRPTVITAKTKYNAKFSYEIRNWGQLFLYFFGVYEPAVAAYAASVLVPGDVVVDVGANAGIHTVLFSRLVGPRGRVHAIEASPSIFKRLQANLALNGAEGNTITHNVAILDAPGRVPVYLHDSYNDGGTTIVSTEAARRDTHQEGTVEGKPLEQVIPIDDLMRAKLIKIDVEGAEWLVVQGMRPILPRLPRDCSVLVEVTPRALADFGASVEDLKQLFESNGFEAFRLPRQDVEFYIRRPSTVPQTLTDDRFELADLLFRRP